MRKRLALDAKLKALLGDTFSVYFQPPNNLEIKTPACIYSFEAVNDKRADNVKFLQFERYSVKLVVPSCEHQRVLDCLADPTFEYVTQYQTGVGQYNVLFRTSI